MMNIAVCDDEPVFLDELRESIDGFFDERFSRSEAFGDDRSDILPENINKLYDKYSIKCYNSGSELIAEAGKVSFDIIFLDIKMEGRDGLETARILRRSGFEGTVIFVTVEAGLVFDSFAVGAGDYIVKPVSKQRLYGVLDRAVRKHIARRLTVRHEGEDIIIPFDDILYCEVLDKETAIHTASGCVSFRGSLGRLAERLDDTFFPCHRSFLVNLRYIERIGSSEVTVRGGAKVPLSRLRRQGLKAAMADFTGEWL